MVCSNRRYKNDDKSYKNNQNLINVLTHHPDMMIRDGQWPSRILRSANADRSCLMLNTESESLLPFLESEWGMKIFKNILLLASKTSPNFRSHYVTSIPREIFSHLPRFVYVLFTYFRWYPCETGAGYCVLSERWSLATARTTCIVVILHGNCTCTCTHTRSVFLPKFQKTRCNIANKKYQQAFNAKFPSYYDISGFF